MSFVKEFASDRVDQQCAAVCGLGSAEVVLLKRVLGLCLSLRIVLSGSCPGAAKD
jgi:hypothetical protein